MNNGNELPLERCPHCSIAKPHIDVCPGSRTQTRDCENGDFRVWNLYACGSCGGVILTVSRETSAGLIMRMWPEGDVVSQSIPDRARDLLRQAMESKHSPSGAQILAAASIDSMLKAKGYADVDLENRGIKDPKLFNRIKTAEADHLITPEMAAWAHEVRLDANDQRHADESVPLPTKEEAGKTIEFAKALAEFLFVLPAMVTRGRAKTTPAKTPAKQVPGTTPKP